MNIYYIYLKIIFVRSYDVDIQAKSFKAFQLAQDYMVRSSKLDVGNLSEEQIVLTLILKEFSLPYEIVAIVTINQHLNNFYPCSK